MEYRKLGKTGIRVSCITHGCMELGGSNRPEIYWDVRDEEINVRLLQKALSLGINCFDTAESYGNGRSEIIVGRALASVRSQCVLATKIAKTHLHADDIERSVEGSLRRLQTDYIDLYYVHWPNPDIPLSETMTKLEKLRESGVLRAIGVSNFHADQLKEALQYAQIDAYQPEYNLLSRDIEQDIIPLCAANQISVFSYNSLAKGILTGIFHSNGGLRQPEDFRSAKALFQPSSLEMERPLIDCLMQLAKKYDATPAQIAVRWLLDQPAMTSTIIGTQNSKHFVDNIRAAELALDADDICSLSTVSADVINALKAKE